MIEADKRKAIFLLHQEGMPLREIARRLQVSRNTVAVVIAQGGQLPKLVRSPKQKIDSQLLQRLYEQCDGWIQRMQEKLAEEQGIEVKYSTLTRMLRHLGNASLFGDANRRRTQSLRHDDASCGGKDGATLVVALRPRHGAMIYVSV
jgi:transposase